MRLLLSTGADIEAKDDNGDTTLLSTLGDDNNTSDIALAVAGGHSPHEIRQKFGLTETQYESALTRIRRRILKHKRREASHEA